MRFLLTFLFFLFLLPIHAQKIVLTVLGTAQDAGAPQMNCTKKCCVNRWSSAAIPVVSLGINDEQSNHFFMFEATPNIVTQHNTMKLAHPKSSWAGIFITHAHIGHYSGLMFLGKEAMGASKIPVFAMPKMQRFLKENAPWNQLVSEENIFLKPLSNGNPVVLSPQLKVTPIQVPHRDEFSETVGYLIEGPTRKALFIPDIDKWERWDIPIENLVAKVDIALLDATFFNSNELPNRNMNEIPHPFVVESLDRWKSLPFAEKNKIYLIHFNHTNPLLHEDSQAQIAVENAGIRIAQVGQQFVL